MIRASNEADLEYIFADPSEYTAFEFSKLTRAEIFSCVARSVGVYTFCAEEIPHAMFGVTPASMLADSGEIWFIASRVRPYQFKLLRDRPKLAELLPLTIREVSATIANPVNAKFARFAGLSRISDNRYVWRR